MLINHNIERNRRHQARIFQTGMAATATKTATSPQANSKASTVGTPPSCSPNSMVTATTSTPSAPPSCPAQLIVLEPVPICSGGNGFKAPVDNAGSMKPMQIRPRTAQQASQPNPAYWPVSANSIADN